MSARGWCRFFARFLLGLPFFMAGWFKCFQMTPIEHARRFFTVPYADTWIPGFLLLTLGVAIPLVELVAGFALLVGLRLRLVFPTLAGLLLVVTYGHLLKDPFYSLADQILPRALLLMAAWLLPAAQDRASIDYWLERRPAGSGAA